MAVLRRPNVTFMSQLAFKTMVDKHFPENFDVTSTVHISSYGIYHKTRKVFLSEASTLMRLQQFCDTELEDRWGRLETTLKEIATTVLEKCSAHAPQPRMNIEEHELWKEFKSYSNVQDNDETCKNFVEFIKNKLSKLRS